MMMRFKSYMKDFGIPTIACILLTLMYVSDARSQNVITFTAEATSGTETVTPILTWSTSPVANACFASGDWSGSKGPSGSETLPAIMTGATYNLTCEWPNDTALLSWTPPTENTDGSPYTDPRGYKLYYGNDLGGPYPNEIDIPDFNTVTHTVTGLPSGDWFFVATAYNFLNVESVLSNETMKNLGLATGQESIGITINPRPNVVTGLTVQ